MVRLSRWFGRRRALRRALIAAAVLAAAGSASAAEFRLGAGDRVVGAVGEYVARSGDNLADIARHFDIGYTEILTANPGVDPWSPGVGRRLTIPSVYILPDAPRRGIVINLAELRLYYFPPHGGTVETFPIGIGVIGATTPLGTTTVVRKEPNPTWVPPASIRAEKPDLPPAIGPGPDNPLGAFALRLGWTNYLVHGTNKPDGVGRSVSHGCIRMYPEDIERLFGAAAVGTPVRTVSQPAAAAWIGAALYVAAHPDKDQSEEIDTERPMTPRPVDGLRETVAKVAGDAAGAVDWRAVDEAGLRRSGLPVPVATRSADSVAQVTPPGALPAGGAAPFSENAREVQQEALAEPDSSAAGGEDEGSQRFLTRRRPGFAPAPPAWLRQPR